MRKTLLDLITGCVSPQEARQFYRAMGADSNQLLEKVAKYYEKPGPIRQYFDNLTRNLFGEKKSPLDLSASEIDRLTQVVTDRDNTLTIDIALGPDVFSGPMPDDGMIQKKLIDFYYGHHKEKPKPKVKMDGRPKEEIKKDFEKQQKELRPQQMELERQPLTFVSVNDLTYNPAKKMLHVHASKRLVKEFLEYLNLKTEYINKLLVGDHASVPGAQEPPVHFEFPLSDISDVASDAWDELKPQQLKAFQSEANKFMARGKGKLKIEGVGKPQGAKIIYDGPFEVLDNLFLQIANGRVPANIPLAQRNVWENYFEKLKVKK